jgi:hypothetical protein
LGTVTDSDLPAQRRCSAQKSFKPSQAFSIFNLLGKNVKSFEIEQRVSGENYGVGMADVVWFE